MAQGDKDAAFMQIVDNQLPDRGFEAVEIHTRVNEIYKESFGSTGLDNLGFVLLSHDRDVRSLLLAQPLMGLFTPFTLLVYKRHDENATYVSHLSDAVISSIVGLKTPGHKERLHAIYAELDDAINKHFTRQQPRATGPKVEKAYREWRFRLPGKQHVSEETYSFRQQFEEVMESEGFLIAGYKNYKETYSALQLPFERYEDYWVFAVCDFEFSNALINSGRPDVGVLTPCPVYMYVEEGSNEIIIGTVNTRSWITLMDITDTTMRKRIEAFDEKMQAVMKSAGYEPR